MQGRQTMALEDKRQRKKACAGAGRLLDEEEREPIRLWELQRHGGPTEMLEGSRAWRALLL